MHKFLIQFSDPTIAPIYLWAKDENYVRVWADRVWPHQRIELVAMVVEKADKKSLF